jgi:hypothetical protein
MRECVLSHLRQGRLHIVMTKDSPSGNPTTIQIRFHIIAAKEPDERGRVPYCSASIRSTKSKFGRVEVHRNDSGATVPMGNTVLARSRMRKKVSGASYPGLTPNTPSKIIAATPRRRTLAMGGNRW